MSDDRMDDDVADGLSGTMSDLCRFVTRVELHGEGVSEHYVIDRRKHGDIDITLDLQDNGRTLKVFAKRREG